MGNLPPIRLLEARQREELRRRQERRQFALQRRLLRHNVDAMNLSEARFISFFRLNREAVQYLITSIGPMLEARGGPRTTFIPVPNRILVALFFYANGSYQAVVGNNMLANVSQASASRIISKVTRVLVLWGTPRYLPFPSTEAERAPKKQAFWTHFGLPDILGCVDGTHIAIVTPREREDAYVNRKGYHSINTQIVCDYDLNILNIMAKYPGSSHDAFVWSNSRVSGIISGNFFYGDSPTRLLGDSGYPLHPWLLTPYPNPRPDSHESRFNGLHTRARNCVERCIGVLKARFRCLLRDRTLHYEPRAACRIIMTCAILHNLALQRRLEDPGVLFDEMDLMEPDPVPPPAPAQPRHNILRNPGARARDEYALAL